MRSLLFGILVLVPCSLAVSSALPRDEPIEAKQQPAPPNKAEKPQAKKPTKPCITMQAISVGHLLDAWRKLTRTVEGEKAVKQFEAMLKDSLEEKGLTGIDTVRPAGAYMKFGDKPQDTRTVLVLPIGKEADFLDLLERVEIDVDGVADSPGLYELELFGGPTTLRFHEKYAYIGIHIEAAVFVAEVLVPPDELFRHGNSSLACLRVESAEVSETARTAALDIGNFQNVLAFLNTHDNGCNEGLAKDLADIPGQLKELVEMFFKSEGVLTFRVPFEHDTARTGLIVEIESKPGSPLTKIMSAWTPATNRFAGLLTSETAAATLITLPSFDKTLSRSLSAAIVSVVSQAIHSDEEDTRETLQRSMVKVIEAFYNTGGEYAHIVAGPDKTGAIANIVAIAHNNPAAVEKAFRAALMTLPRDDPFAASVKWDVAKVAGTAIHTIDYPHKFLDDPAFKQFVSEKSRCAFALTRDAIYLVCAPDPIEVMKTVLAATPGTTPANALLVNPKRWHAIQKRLIEEAPDADRPVVVPDWVERIGQEDRLQSRFDVTTTVKDGKFQITFNVESKLLPMLFKDHLK